ncbi:MAG: hypothetical protein IPH57_12735 [Saprospiraceae bacterium]|nr:hypothetical protein [Saprospiraceae bacterium]
MKNSKDKSFLEKANLSYIIRLLSTNDVEISKCEFRNHYGTGIHSGDAINLKIEDCVFKNFGVTTYPDINYSSDAIFVGGYTLTNDIKIIGVL